MIQKTKIKNYVNEQDCNLSKECYDKINEKLTLLIEEATQRAKANGRVTLKARDF